MFHHAQALVPMALADATEFLRISRPSCSINSGTTLGGNWDRPYRSFHDSQIGAEMT